MNVLITGANGFIGSNLMTLLADIPNIKLFAGTRETIDLYSSKAVGEYLRRNEITKIIHCAIEGGRRHIPDTPDIVYKNLLMFQNLIQCQQENDAFINIASGAEFDRRNNIYREDERTIAYRIPPDYYGFSKNLIAKTVRGYRNGINLRLFGCFYHNETPERFIRGNIERYLKDEPIIIHQDKYMDFVYLEDLANLIRYLLKKTENRLDHFDRDINLSYNMTYTLRQIADMINHLDFKHHSEIVIEKEGMGLSYCGRGYNFSVATCGDPIYGIESGIRLCYEYFKQNHILH
jgi:nucleoside-diphosphate-sugar epimerase